MQLRKRAATFRRFSGNVIAVLRRLHQRKVTANTRSKKTKSSSTDSTAAQASDYRQRSLDNIESATEVLTGERNTEERAKAQARGQPPPTLLPLGARYYSLVHRR